MNSFNLSEYIETFPDFPKPGILFRDISPMLLNSQVWNSAINQLGGLCDQLQPDIIAGIEARGFLVGVSLSAMKEIPFIPVRKKGKLPGLTYSRSYDLEYGQDILEIKVNSLKAHSRVLIVDDLLATGNTAQAAGELITCNGAVICGFGFIIELDNLNGRDNLPNGIEIMSLIHY